jgi:hypothetical protein
MQFPVRTAVNINDDAGHHRRVPATCREPRSTGGVAGSGTKGIHFMRMLGVSAIAYEVGKDMFGADLSRGLSVGFVPDIHVDKDKTLPIPVPPFADATYSTVRSVLAGGDSSVMADVVPMIVPWWAWRSAVRWVRCRRWNRCRCLGWAEAVRGLDCARASRATTRCPDW